MRTLAIRMDSGSTVKKPHDMSFDRRFSCTVAHKCQPSPKPAGTTTTPQRHHNYSTTTPQPHHTHTTLTPQPHHTHTTTTPHPHHNDTTTTPQPHHTDTTTTPQPHHTGNSNYIYLFRIYLLTLAQLGWMWRVPLLFLFVFLLLFNL